MKISKSTEIKVGLILFSGIALLVLGVILGQGLNLASGSSEIKFIFPNSGGLKISDPIYVNGVKRGQVKSIQNYKDSVLVIGLIDSIDDLKSDLTAQILILEITGGKKIEIKPGISSSRFSKNQIIRGQTPPDLAELVATFGNSSRELVGIVHKIDTTLSALNTIFVDESFVGNLKNIINNTDEILRELNLIMEQNQNNINSTLTDLKSISNDLRSFISNNKTDLNKIVKNLDTISNNTKPLINKADSLVYSLSELSKNLHKVLYDIQNGKGTISKLIYDQNFAQKIDSTLMNLDTLVNSIRKYGVNVNVRLGTRP